LEEHAKLISPWYGPVVVSIIATPIAIQEEIIPEEMAIEPNRPSDQHQRSAEIQIMNIANSKGEVPH